MATVLYTPEQATDEAVRLLTRKLQRLYPRVYREMVDRLPEGACTALAMADARADMLRADGIERDYPALVDDISEA